MTDTGLFWIRDDFRIENNPALSFATQKHVNFYLDGYVQVHASWVLRITNSKYAVSIFD